MGGSFVSLPMKEEVDSLVSFPGQPASAKAPLKVLSLAKEVDWSIEIGAN